MFVLILERLKALLPNTTLSDTVLMLYVEEAYRTACGYCNRVDFPEGAYTSLALLTKALILSNDINSNITSMSEGGRSVSFGQVTGQDMINNSLKSLDIWRTARTI